LRVDGTIVEWGINVSVTNFPANLSGIVGIAAGDNHALVLRSNGTVFAWGLNNAGQTNVPTNLSNVVAVAAGTSHSAALRSDGTVVVWGGTATDAQTNIPAGLFPVTRIDGGALQTMALRADGTVVSWGGIRNPAVPTGLKGVAGISASPSSTGFDLAVDTNGLVTAWGSGPGTNVPAGLQGIVAVEAGGFEASQTFGLGLRSNGMVIAWGSSSPSGVTNVPAGVSNAVAIAAGSSHALALLNDGRPLLLHPPVGGTFYSGRDLVLPATAVGNAPLSFQWFKDGSALANATNQTLVVPSAQSGDAGNYQLVVSNALGVAQSVFVPVIIVDSPPVLMSQPAGGYAYYGSPFSVSTSVIGSGPLTFQWLQNGLPGPGGTNYLVIDRTLPQHGGAYQLIASNSFGAVTSSVAQITFSRVAAWGTGPALSNAPVDLGTVTAVASGYFHALAIKPDGTVAAWGTTANGVTNVPPGLSNVVAVAGGSSFSVALKADGTVVAWGAGSVGQTNVPAGLSNVVAISAGASHVLALRSNGTVVAWGLNSTSQATVPAGLSNVVAVAAGSIQSLALRNDGTMVGWGGIGKIPSTTNVVAIAAGYSQSLALQADGTVVGWGATPQPAGAAPPAGLSNVVAISAGGGAQGFFHSIALKSDGTMVGWGNNSFGQLNVPGMLDSAIAISAGGGSSLALLNDRSPVVTAQPFNRHAASGTNVTLAGLSVGQPALGYQWFFNNASLPGATSQTLTLPGVNRNSRGLYSLSVSNALGATNSLAAQLDVGGPVRLLPPAAGADGTLSVALQDSFGGSLTPGDLAHFEVLASTNLVEWTLLPGALVYTNGALLLQDGPAANHPARFYRILEQ
jgi:alpha-tubulin suppressor-like RCC1 family protein